ncbi:hypothetical protein CONLIGDRAFT_693898 [Coniochaeta ligniaria NRRL 30616]|uniref:Uncharacterized protein n=1 Tax=Coniochaeta ligniaria NRRL 30616 TaxID=1408157 RepID=A0A1J7J712_9PEZI|nr:hypothetical protein CONLIGDRAFT_693898 [Coniochaeta ligniaria NRRL 30616]
MLIGLGLTHSSTFLTSISQQLRSTELFNAQFRKKPETTTSALCTLHSEFVHAEVSAALLVDSIYPESFSTQQSVGPGVELRLRVPSTAMAPPDFESIWQQVFGTGSRGLATTEKQNLDRLRHLLPDDGDYKAFWDYDCERANKHVSEQLNPIITLHELIKTIDTERLQSPATYTPLTRKMTHMTVPWIPLGCNPERTLLYRVAPDPYWLEPHDSSLPVTQHQILPLCFLGINATANLSERSTVSAESDDSDMPGFNFFQVGKLEWVDTRADGETEPYRLDGADWADTGFCVVARLDRTGHAAGIYVVADMFPFDEETGEREQIVGPHWGIPPHSHNLQFSCAKVGQRLGDMGFATEVEWTQIIEHPVELVCLTVMGDGSAMRATVDEAGRDRF